MAPLLYLSHAILGAAALLCAGAEPAARSRYLRGLSAVGVLSATVLFFAPDAGHVWRTTQLATVDGRVVGVAAGCAWLLLAAIESGRGEGRWDAAVLVGVGSTGLAFLAAGRWAVPLLLLWLPAVCGLAAVVATRLSRLLVGLGTAGVVAGLAVAAAISHSWTVALPIEGWPVSLVASGAALYAVAGATLGSDREVTVSATATPLLVGAGFVLLSGPARSAGPSASLGALVLALVAGLIALRARDSVARWVGLWIVAAMGGVALLSFDPYLVSRAATGGILATSVVALWPASLGRAQIERGALVAVLALTAGFNAVAAAGSISFAHAIATDDVTKSAAWAAVASLLPAVIAIGVAIGARLARHSEREAYTVPGVLATWALFIVAVLIGVFPFGAHGPSGVTLYLVAAAAGVAAARFFRRAAPVPATGGALAELDARSFRIPGALEKVAGSLASALLVAAVVTTIGFAYEGLRVGFL
jgi:hypothetical protein